jgi:hypothetical protein
MKIYFICPVRRANEKTTAFAANHVKKMEKAGHEIFWPQRDVDQNDETGFNIVTTELIAINMCDEVHVYWDKDSKGSHFDLGAAMIAGKRIVHVGSVEPDGPEKSYEKVMRIMMERDFIFEFF